MNYYVEATTKDGFEMSDEIEAEDLNELAQFVRETIAYHRDGVGDTSEVDCSHIKFTYAKVLDEDDNDVTKEANEAK